MKIYFAGADVFHKYLEEKKIDNLLFSYFFLKKDGTYSAKHKFLDSGAFSAFSSGKHIDLDKYIDFLKNNGKQFEVYANLDDIKDPEKTLENQKKMESEGLTPIPCFHYGEDLKYLKDYAEDYAYIALGGLVPYAKDSTKLNKWLDKCFAILMPYIKEKGLKVHGFGVGSSKVLINYPFYSADATSWLCGGKFGRLVKWDDRKMVMSGGTHYEDKRAYTEQGGNLDLMDHYHNRNLHNIREFQKMEKDLTKLWESRGITWKE